MGCEFSCGREVKDSLGADLEVWHDTAGIRLAILVRGAEELAQADGVTKSDPFFKCRLGKPGTDFLDKDPRTERRSHTVMNSDNPIWNFSALYKRDPHTDTGLELHITIWDADWVKSNDPLGEARVPIADLEAAPNAFLDFPMVQGTGKVTVMTGSHVEEHMLRHLASLASKGVDDGMTRKGSEFWQLWQAVGEVFADNDDDLRYSMTMTSFLGGGLSGPSGLRQWFLKRSSDAEGKDTYIWKGPCEKDCTTYSGHADVVEQLAALGDKLGTNDRNGAAYRRNALGFQLYSSNHMWPELGEKGTIGLGQTQENHAFMRKWVVKVVGPEGRWTTSEVRAAAEAFWKRPVVRIGHDTKTWVTQVLHKVHLGLDIAVEDAEQFSDMQQRILVGTVAPKVAHGILGITKALEQKAERMNRYMKAIQAVFPDEPFTKDQLILLASGTLDSLMFAGGQSVPTVVSMLLGLLYSKWGKENLPADFKLRKSTVRQYVMEVIRRFPPVAGISWVEKSLGFGQPDQLKFVNVFMASRDPRVWGADSDELRLRPLEDYDRLSVAWGEPAVCPHLGSVNSHACPAKDLSLVMATEFLSAFVKSTIGEEAFEADMPADLSTWESSEKPEDLSINEYGCDNFSLARK